jgi:CheY-like chemotaxis protein
LNRVKVPEVGTEEKGKRGPVLVVDDDADIRAMLAQILELEGYAVSTAADGADALAQLRAVRPALVLLDLMMPGMNGWEFRAAQAQDPAVAHIPVVILSGDGSADVKSSTTGVVGFLRKPIDLETLLSTVLQHCL